MIDFGQLTAEQAQVCQIRNHITRALGVSDQVEATINSWNLKQSAVVLLCSDGLTEYLNDPAIERVLATHRPILDCVYRFLEDANNCGGKDNISAGIIEFSLEDKAVEDSSDCAITLTPQRDEDITVCKIQP